MIILQEISVVQRAATLEIQRRERDIYYTATPYTIFVNGQEWMRGTTNVFTLFGLTPEMYYTVQVRLENGQQASCDFITPKEAMLLDVTRFGAVGDGITDCTHALQAAIAACKPGGTVLLPAGTYHTYPLFLKSNILFYLEKGATLLAGTERNCYPVLPGMVQTPGGEESFGTWEGDPLDSYASLLTAIETDGLTIAGEGVIDGNALAADWWQDWRKRRGAWRPRTVYAVRCTNLTIMGVTVQNSPAWTLHPYYCRKLDILNVRVQNPPDSPNTDGCNPESCEDVRIIGAHISVGDDCISLKSGKYYMAKFHHQMARGTVIRNCLLERGHGAVVLGSEIAGGAEKVLVEQCLMKNTDRGLRVKTRRGRGNSCHISNIEFGRVKMENVQTPFVIGMFYFCDPDGHSDYVRSKKMLPVDEFTPFVQNLYCHDICCTGAQFAGMFFYGLPEKPIEMIRLENVNITFDEQALPGLPSMMDDVEPVKRVALFATNVETLCLHNVHFSGQQGETYQIENVPQFSVIE